MSRSDRATGALLGLAIGDALGMPTQSMSREQILDRYGFVTGFLDAAPDQPIAPSMPAGSVTDDTEQAVLVGELLVDGGGHIEPLTFARALIAWEQVMIQKGSLDLLGPSTKSALVALQSGVAPDQAGRFGTTNGAAMRIAPIGIAFAPGPTLLRAVVEASLVTHHTGLGLSAAAMIAAAVSTGIDDGSIDEMLAAAVAAGREGQQLGHWVAGASIPDRFEACRGCTTTLDNDQFADFLYRVVGTSVQSQESVVSALLIVDRYRHEPFDGLCLAASLGGDTDTIAAMAGAVLGSHHGAEGFPLAYREAIAKINHLDLELLATRLLALRS